MLKIVLLDAKTLGESANFRSLEKKGELEVFDHTEPEEIVERCRNKEVIITNKVILDESILAQLPKLKLICVAATGINNVDLDYAKQKGITVKNVNSYSTDSVAQLTISMLLYLVTRPFYFDNFVKSGAYSRSKMFTHFGFQYWELAGKRLGIIGLGNIGRKVAHIAQSFGMEIVFYSTSGRNNNINYKRFDLDTLLSTSDVVSIHAPLNSQTKHLINYEKIKLMKPCSILLNTGRGGIISEPDLARALNENIIGAAGLDVFEQEPIDAGNPLLKIFDKDKLLLTPHVAWTSIEARQRLIEKLSKNIEEFIMNTDGK
jgi:lactate dehydrogenase-like 2-hydroxyacid dehydrogenase